MNLDKTNPSLASAESVFTFATGPSRIEIPERLKRQYALQRFYQQPVTQYDRQGRRIADYSDVKSAARAVYADLHGLVAALTGKLLSCADCYWRLGKEMAWIDVDAENNAQLKYLRKISLPVVQYSASGKKIMTYPKMADARRATGVSELTIGRVLARKAKMAKGFIWKVG